MSDEQTTLPAFLAVLVVVGLIVRFFFFSGSSSQEEMRPSAASLRAREAAVERIQQMFPQADRRSILWDLQRGRGNVQATTERILAGRLETPPVTFQPPPPPGQTISSILAAASRAADRPTQPDLITRYRLKERVGADVAEKGEEEEEEKEKKRKEETDKKGKGWSSNREERQKSLNQRRDEMILAARRKMEAKIAAEKASTGS